MRDYSLWTKADEDYLLGQIKKKSLQEIAKHLKRTLRSVRWKALDMNIKSDHRWSAEEIRILHKNQHRDILVLMQKLPDRSKGAIMYQRRKLKIN